MLNDMRAARSAMIVGQLAPNLIADHAVLQAMGMVPREFFVPIDFAGSAYVDEEIPLGQGRMAMEPLVLAKLLQGLRLRGHERVLIIGGAMGYSAALVAHMAAQVVMVEEQPALAQHARNTLPLLGIRNVEVIESALTAPAVTGTFHAALIEGAVQLLPPSITCSVAQGGRIAYVENRRVRSDGLKGAATGLGVLTIGTLVDAAVTPSYLGESGVTLLPGFSAPAQFSFT